jgi:hypothetical protein
LVSLTHPSYSLARHRGLTSCNDTYFQALLWESQGIAPFGREMTC